MLGMELVRGGGGAQEDAWSEKGREEGREGRIEEEEERVTSGGSERAGGVKFGCAARQGEAREGRGRREAEGV